MIQIITISRDLVSLNQLLTCCNLTIFFVFKISGRGYQKDVIWWQTVPGEMAGHTQRNTFPSKTQTSELHQLPRMLPQRTYCLGRIF